MKKTKNIRRSTGQSKRRKTPRASTSPKSTASDQRTSIRVSDIPVTWNITTASPTSSTAPTAGTTGNSSGKSWIDLDNRSGFVQWEWKESTPENRKTEIAWELPDGILTRGGAKNDVFATGYQRDTSEGKPAFDLLPPDALEELGILFAEGAKKYGSLNYRKGCPLRRTCASMLRHGFKALRKLEDEGATLRSRRVRHFIATAWNALVAAQTLIDIDNKKLSPELDDRVT